MMNIYNLTPNQLKMNEGYLGIDFYLSKSCNKTCHYCTAWTLEMRNLEVDMEFLTNTLEYLKDYKVKINLLGGEPGLIKNLQEVINKIKEYDNFIPSILSNSLVRRKYPNVIEDKTIYYLEHLVLDFEDDHIDKLGNYDFFDENDSNNYNVIIKTPKFKKYKDNHDISNLFHRNSIFKDFNSRSPGYNEDHQAPEIERRMCAAFPMVPVIDFELKKIRHCSKKVINGSATFDVTKDNIEKMMNFKLFKYETYCEKCTEVISRHPIKHALRILESGNI